MPNIQPYRRFLDSLANFKSGTLRPSVMDGFFRVNLLCPKVVPDCKLAVLVTEDTEGVLYRIRYRELEERGENICSLVVDRDGNGGVGTPILRVLTRHQIATPTNIRLLHQIAPDLVIIAIDLQAETSVTADRIRKYLVETNTRAIYWRM